MLHRNKHRDTLPVKHKLKNGYHIMQENDEWSIWKGNKHCRKLVVGGFKTKGDAFGYALHCSLLKSYIDF